MLGVLFYIPDVPDAPSCPKVTAYDSTSVSLEWKPPDYNGSHPIQGYLVEKREKGGDWIKLNPLPTPNLNYIAQGLTTGSRYEFRVKAVNEAGLGKPSRPSQAVVTKEPKCKSRQNFRLFDILMHISIPPVAPDSPARHS